MMRKTIALGEYCHRREKFLDKTCIMLLGLTFVLNSDEKFY